MGSIPVGSTNKKRREPFFLSVNTDAEANCRSSMFAIGEYSCRGTPALRETANNVIYNILTEGLPHCGKRQTMLFIIFLPRGSRIAGNGKFCSEIKKLNNKTPSEVFRRLRRGAKSVYLKADIFHQSILLFLTKTLLYDRIFHGA